MCTFTQPVTNVVPPSPPPPWCLPPPPYLQGLKYCTNDDQGFPPLGQYFPKRENSSHVKIIQNASCLPGDWPRRCFIGVCPYQALFSVPTPQGGFFKLVAAVGGGRRPFYGTRSSRSGRLLHCGWSWLSLAGQCEKLKSICIYVYMWV